MEIRDILIYFALKYKGDFDAIYNAIRRKEKIEEKELKKALEELNCQTMTLLDKDYPVYFKALNKPPFVLFYIGDRKLFHHEKKLSVVGTRKPSSYGKKITKELLDDVLDKVDVVIVSGLALGIDSLAHLCALENKRKTIAILANGIDDYYIKSNYSIYERIKKEGLIISEYPKNTKVNKENFAVRNRLIAAFSPVIFVPEAFNNSGTSLTLNYALDLGKNILCVPRNIDIDSLCNAYIQQGAKLIIKAEDIIEEI